MVKMGFRWFGESDPIPLSYIREIPNLSVIVTAVYGVKVGEVWPKEQLEALKDSCLQNHLSFEVVESIPVSEDIKLGNKNRDALIEVYKENIRRCSEVGVKCVCYNFMPVFDWIRTDLSHKNDDGSISLSYSDKDFQKLDPKNLHLPGWDESYSPDQLKGLLDAYQNISHEQLFENLVYFLKAIMPVCHECHVSMAIHPDDPPWDVFHLPRIVSTKEDLERLFRAVPEEENGLTLCVGSLGEDSHNDIYDITDTFSKEKRIKFVHLRNIHWDDKEGSFHETGQLSKDGSLDMAKIVEILTKNGFDGYVRPDHGRNIWGEKGKPGYGLYDRALGVAYLNGLFEMAERKKKK